MFLKLNFQLNMVEEGGILFYSPLLKLTETKKMSRPQTKLQNILPKTSKARTEVGKEAEDHP